MRLGIDRRICFRSTVRPSLMSGAILVVQAPVCSAQTGRRSISLTLAQDVPCSTARLSSAAGTCRNSLGGSTARRRAGQIPPRKEQADCGNSDTDEVDPIRGDDVAGSEPQAWMKVQSVIARSHRFK